MRVKNNIEFRKNQQGTVKKLEPENGEIDDPVEINKELNSFYETFFQSEYEKASFNINEMIEQNFYFLFKLPGKTRL